MGSSGFYGEPESQPCTSKSRKFKLPRKLLDDCCAVNNAAVPRKLRSAIKKRDISMKQNRVCGRVETLRENGSKKSKRHTKHGQITKDEKEVAETLFSLANMFYDLTKKENRCLDIHHPETNSSTDLKAGSSITAAQGTETGKMAIRVTLEDIFPSSDLVESSSQIVQFKSFDDSQLCKLPISKQYTIPFASGVQSDLVTGSRKKPLALTTVPSDSGITTEWVAAPGIQNCRRDDKNSDLFMWPRGSSSAVTQSSKTLESNTGSSNNKLPAWLENTNPAIQHYTSEESFTKNTHHLVEVGPMGLRKRCSAHVYISHFIKVMQISDRKEGSPGTPAQLATSGCVEPGPVINTDNQENRIGCPNSGLSSNVSSIQDAFLFRKHPFQDQEQVSKTSALCSPLKQGSDFLSLAGHSEEVVNKFHSSYLQSQNHLSMLLERPQNCYSTLHDRSSTVATQQKQTPPVQSSRFGSRAAFLCPAQYQQAGVSSSYLQLPDWINGERDSSFLTNYAQARGLFPHLHSMLGSNNQQSPQQQFSAIHLPPSLPNIKGYSQSLPSGFDRNRAMCYPGGMSQLQILCDQQHL